MTCLLNFRKIKTGKNYKSIFINITIVTFLIYLIIFPKYVSNGIQKGMNCCLNTLIPSMFPFMIISSMLMMTITKQKPKIIFQKISKFLFYLPEYALPLLIMSLFGGYPIGAYCAKHLYKNKMINEEQLNRIMSFCVNSGPAFIISVLGESLLKSRKVGLKLFFIQTGSSLLIGIFCGIIARIRKIPFYSNTNTIQNNNPPFVSILVDSCHNTCRSLINMCSLITLFFGITSLLNTINITRSIVTVLQKLNISPCYLHIVIVSALEMTQSCILATKNLYCPYHIYSWIIGFGGLCAHTQIIAEFKNCPFKYRKFLIIRILNGIITAFVTEIIIKNQDFSLKAYSSLQQSFKVSTSAPTHLGSIVLLIFCVVFTLDSYLLPPKHTMYRADPDTKTTL